MIAKGQRPLHDNDNANWDDTGNSIVEQIAGIDDFEVAVATYWAAVARWPAARITLRQGARVVMKTWTE